MIEKIQQIKALLFQAELSMREATLDFGMSFSAPHRFLIEPLIQRIRQAITNEDERLVEMTEQDCVALQNAILDLERDTYSEHQKYEDETQGFGATLFFTKDEE
jgi:molecular chaperone DnaK